MLRMGRFMNRPDTAEHAQNSGVLLAWPPSGAPPEGVREENSTADE
jgi:hypothetical protein